MYYNIQAHLYLPGTSFLIRGLDHLGFLISILQYYKIRHNISIVESIDLGPVSISLKPIISAGLPFLLYKTANYNANTYLRGRGAPNFVHVEGT